MSERILVVGDDRDCADALCRLLGTLGYGDISESCG